MPIILGLLKDLFDRYKPSFLHSDEYAFAFLVHPRDGRDIQRKFPSLRHMPRWLWYLIERFLWSTTVTEVTGLHDKQGRKVPGYIISIPMTAASMMGSRTRAVRHIRSAVKLARNKGARIVGLGALTSSLTQGGNLLLDIPGTSITTGHAYTGYNVTRYLFTLVHDHDIDLNKITVGIVGAAGSIGGISAKIFSRAGVGKLILIDLDRKLDSVRTLAGSFVGDVEVTSDLSALRNAHFIIAATNAPGALIQDSHVTAGTVIIDDAQPSDVHEEVFNREDVVVLEAGAVRTPGITSNFDIGLYGNDVNYCCMAELLLLAHEKRDTHYVTGFPTLDLVDEMAVASDSLGFTLPPYQNMYGLIDNGTIEEVMTLLHTRV